MKFSGLHRVSLEDFLEDIFLGKSQGEGLRVNLE